jgi:NDP-sugar pyrophosphorylase family protein
MKCLILASIRNERLASFEGPPALIKLLGVSLIDRILFSARDAGLTEFVIVTAAADHQVRHYADKFARTYNLTIEHVVNDAPNKGNAYAVSLARSFLTEAFILTSLDYLIDPQTFRALRAKTVKRNDVCVAVDRDTLSVRTDLMTITRVELEANGVVTDMNLGLVEFDGFSTGAYLCGVGLFEAIDTQLQIHPRELSLLALVQSLIAHKQVHAYEINGHFWSHIDSLDAFMVAEEALLKRVNKKTDDNPVKRFILRGFSRYITQLFLALSINVRQISGIGFAFSALAALLMSVNHYYGLVIGAVLAFIAVIIHVAQEEVAVLRYQQSGHSQWFDSVLGQYGEMALLLGLTLHTTYHDYLGMNPVLIGVLAIVGCFMFHYSSDKYQQWVGTKPSFQQEMFINRDVVYMVTILGALFNIALFALLVMMILFNAMVIRRLFVWREEE